MLLPLLLLLVAQDAPVATSPAIAPAQPAPLPAEAAPPPATGDYAYVAECLGSLSGFLAARDTALPEVERIERDWAGRLGGTTAEAAMAEYQTLLVQAEQDQSVLRRALTSAQAASASDLVTAGAAATASARGKWNIGDKRLLAREWMSWALPSRCLREAAALEQRSTLNAALLRATTSAQPDPTPAQATTPQPAPSDPAAQPTAETPAPAAETPAPTTATPAPTTATP
jgi:hypothetical protein